MPNVAIVPKLRRCLFSVSAAKRDGIYTVMGSGPHLLAGGDIIPPIEMNGLFVLMSTLAEAVEQVSGLSLGTSDKATLMLQVKRKAWV